MALKLNKIYNNDVIISSGYIRSISFCGLTFIGNTRADCQAVAEMDLLVANLIPNKN